MILILATLVLFCGIIVLDVRERRWKADSIDAAWFAFAVVVLLVLAL